MNSATPPATRIGWTETTLKNGVGNFGSTEYAREELRGRNVRDDDG